MHEPRDCVYFLGRVHDELERLDGAMEADPQGPGHFPEPIAWTAEVCGTAGADRTCANLEPHEKDLIGARDRIDVRVRDHPDDCR
ncbi:hypothetical protein ACFU5O_06755 [Streptomyces sp. NPDC057445]|uniref:hypothetical protein n=1 Tax=Streptomyces sp. NPDC057445 TaxID=3346136 RepID=UPI003695D82B